MTKLVSCAVLAVLASTAAAQSTPDLTGLWEATLRFGPDVRGPLLIYQTPQGWIAEIAGYKVAAARTGQSFAFKLPGGNGELRNGFWISDRNEASPVRLAAAGPNRWRAEIQPIEDRYTVWLPVSRQPDGTLRTYIRNPEFNFGYFLRATHIELGNSFPLSGTARGPGGADVRLVGSWDPLESTCRHASLSIL